jgi:4-diphosphocytidyl-2-C-methyl-D-erythritol kinase
LAPALLPALFFMATPLEKGSPCKVNLLMNILGRRPDGFHDLETVMHPVRLEDTLRLARGGAGVTLTCSDPELPVDGRNLVHRAATGFLAAAGVPDGVTLHLEKRIPMAAGLGGGSGNAATTLLGLNELFGRPLDADRLQALAAALGSDVPFFLQDGPALGTGRGERIEPLGAFAAMQGRAFLLIHPGFGISTPWAYQQLARFPAALHGRPGRARELVGLLHGTDWSAAAAGFYNSLEAPALEKFPLLVLYQEFLRAEGALVALMSGSGSTTFAITRDEAGARRLEERVQARFGPCWTAVVPA